MFSGLGIVLLFLCIIWLIGLSFLFYRFYSYYQRITNNTHKDNLLKILDDLFKESESNVKKIEELYKLHKNVELKNLQNIQKIGLVRFNPFKDTGGDQSFILAILDAKDTGVVISSLHTRAGTRWYAKKVEKGRAVEYTLSEDEQKAIKEAKAS